MLGLYSLWAFAICIILPFINIFNKLVELMFFFVIPLKNKRVILRVLVYFQF